MLWRLLRSVAVQAAAMLAFLLSLAFFHWVFVSEEKAVEFMTLTIRNMLGVWVWGFGAGLAHFIYRNGKSFANDVRTLLMPSEPVAQAIGIIERSTSHREALRLSLPITILGAILTTSYGVPFSGLAKPLIIVGIVAVYYVASCLLSHFSSVISAFHVLHENAEDVSFRDELSPIRLENVMTYLTLTTVTGALGIYCGFRGTITAGFQFSHEVWRSFLTTPLVLFLPATLFYNFYPRYTLRRIVQYHVLVTMVSLPRSEESLDEKIRELRNAATVNMQLLPFVDYKSLPSYLVAILFILSLIYNSDPQLKEFFGYLASFLKTPGK